jgi:hypothetical protein
MTSRKVNVCLKAVHEQTTALDKIVSAYGHIGAALPRFSRYNEAFGDRHDVQQLLAFLYEDIIEFHRRAYRLVKRSGILSSHRLYSANLG